MVTEISTEVFLGIILAEIILEVLGLYLITPWLAKKAFMKALNGSEADAVFEMLIRKVMTAEITLKDSNGKDICDEEGNPKTVGLFDFVVSRFIANLKKQFASLDSAVVRGFINEGGIGKEALEMIPKQWRWIAMIPSLLSRFGPQTQAAVTSKVFKGV